MTLDEARRTVRLKDGNDPVRAMLAAAAVLRHEANYTGDDATLVPVAEHLEAAAQALESPEPPPMVAWIPTADVAALVAWLQALPAVPGEEALRVLDMLKLQAALHGAFPPPTEDTTGHE